MSSTAIFPQLAGLTWDIEATPTWSTIVQRSKNQATTRLMNSDKPLWRFSLSYEFLRDSPSGQGRPPSNPEGYTELEQVVGFFNARGGSFDSFLLDPWLLTGRRVDSEVRGAQIGIGDAATTVFQLQRNYGGFMDEVQNPVAGTVFITVNGVIQTSGWTLGTNGQITFTSAPALNAVITADFRWQWRVRFAEDTLGVQAFMFQLYELQKVKLEQDPQ